MVDYPYYRRDSRLFINRKAYLDGSHEIKTVNWSAISGVIAGATVAINDWTEGTVFSYRLAGL